MNYYAAPMEGITGYLYRRAHHACYPGVDQYFTPFLSPGASHSFTSREKGEILPEHNEGIPVTPQVLTNRAEDFLWVCGELYVRGYRQVNLNLGCPSGTVVSKGKGAAFLGQREELTSFFDACFEGIGASFPGLSLSVKARVGFQSEEEFPALLTLFNRYPLKELILHPRIQTDYYKGKPRREIFHLGLEKSRCPVCYNGDIFTAEDGFTVRQEFSGLNAVMAGRGLIASPWLLEELKDGADQVKTDDPDGKIRRRDSAERLLQFHNMLLESYVSVLSGDRNVLFKMKELWYYMGCHFPDSKKSLKRIRKAARLTEYRAAVQELFANERFDGEAGFSPPE